MLQQGLFVADLLYYMGEDAPGVELGLQESPAPMPPTGYDYDFANTEILNRAKIKNKRIVLPDNMSYSLLILPQKRTMSVPVLRHIRDMVKQGMCLMGPKPESVAGLSNRGNDKEFQQLVSELWGNSAGKAQGFRTIGLGRVFTESSIKKVLEEMQVKPDFDFSSKSSDPAVNFIHRVDGDTEIYFLNNRRRRREHLTALFRTDDKKPEFWDPVTGEIRAVPVYNVSNGQTRIPIELEESGSIFVIFRDKLPAKRLVAVKKGNTEVMTIKPFPATPPLRYKNIFNTFTISTWIKPECEIAVSGMDFARRLDISSFVLYPSPGEKLYGTGHSICGLIAGRNGVVVYERKAEEINPVFEVLSPISGWTHLTLVYENGAPSVYLNGELKGKGKPSGSIVHPSVGEEYQDVYSLYFEGDMTAPQVASTALTSDKIKGLAAEKPAIVPKYPVVEVTGSKNDLLFWENGNYSLSHNDGTSTPLTLSGIDNGTKLTGSWEISFPPNLGAPSSITLPELISLHNHPDNGVKYFSGTASYRKNFQVNEADIGKDNRLYLDLGQVEMLAEIIVNGKNLGIFWKRPYRADITDAVKSGNNMLEVKVTNGWPNRLIGDEQLPQEYSYANEESGRIKEIPDWFIKGEPKPVGSRITFATWKHYQRDSPLLEAGLIGPVILRRAYSHLLT
jgi:hypothetical protein